MCQWDGREATMNTCTCPSFQRVTDIDFDDNRPVTKVRTTAVTPKDDLDW